MMRISPLIAMVAVFALPLIALPAQADEAAPAPTIEALTPSGETENITERMTDPALLVKGHVYLPLRSYADLFDRTAVAWDGKIGVASVERQNKRFTVTAREGGPTSTDAQGFLVAGRTYVPLRACIEFFGGKAHYEKTRHHVQLELTVDLRQPTALAPTQIGLQRFATASAPQFLNSRQGSNDCYSPLSLYLALSMVSQGAQGPTADELMQVLHAESAPALAREATSLMALNHQGDKGSLLLANAIWLNKDFSVNPKFNDLLKTSYQAEANVIDMGKQEDVDKIVQWIREKTKHLIEIKLSPNSRDVMKLINTLYFKGLWSEPFAKESTVDDTFYGRDKKEIKAPFMNGRFDTDYLKTDDFEASSLRFADGCRLRVILPAEGTSPQDLLANAKAMSDLTRDGEPAHVNWSLPRFSFATNYECKEMLTNLGINDAFSEQANFAGIAPNLFISSVDHLTKVTINEAGAEAAAATIITVRETAMPIEEPKPTVDFQVNRPFLFVLETKDALPLFIGQVNDPTLDN